MSRIATFAGPLAVAALALMAADGTAGGAPAEPAPSPVAELEFPQIEGKLSFDCTAMPAQVRLDFLKAQVRAYIANRLNAAHNRHVKDEKVVAWTAYEEASKADPLQTVVPKPEGDKPADPDYMAVYNRAVEDLKAGTVRKQGDTPKPKKTKDPLVATVTDQVVRAVYNSKRAEDPKYHIFAAKKEVGTDGIAYLNAAVEAKVAEGGDRAALVKSMNERYIHPAMTMLGMPIPGKKTSELPSLL
jgi:hypothetical protein